MLELNKIYLGDSLELMKEIPDKSIDLILTDPPYCNIMLKEWNGKNHLFDKFNSISEYLKLIKNSCEEFKRIIKDNGSIYIFADDINSSYVHIEAEKIFSEIGFVLLNHIVWYKVNSMTNKGTNYFKYAPNTERILFWGYPAFIEYDNCLFSPIRDYLRKIKNIIKWKNGELNKYIGQSSMPERHWFVKSQWCMPTEISYKKFDEFCYEKTKNNETLRREYETLRREYETLRREYETLRREYETLRRVFNTDKAIPDVIISNITSSTDYTFHPTQKPIKLFSHLIEVSSNEHDTVLDCFSGSGTTAIACYNLHRNFICIEKDKDYYEKSVKRLENVKAQTRIFN